MTDSAPNGEREELSDSAEGTGSYTGSSFTESGSEVESDYTEESSEDDDEEKEEMVPDEDTMKYRTFTLNCLTASEQITAVEIRTRFIFVATDRGVVNVLDIAGNLLFKYAHHVNLVKDLSCDKEENYIGSCCIGGVVTIKRLYSNSKDDFFTKTFDFPLTSLAIHPNYDTKDSKPFLCGGLDGVVTYVTKTWPFGNRQTTVVGSKEGQIYLIRWQGDLAAWANESSVVLCNVESKAIIHRIPRPQPAPRGDMFRCTLAWDATDTLLIAWGNWVHICEVKSKPSALRDPKALLSSYQVENVCGFQTDLGTTAYRICGAAPFSQNELLLLAVRVTSEVYVHRLQVRLVDRYTGEVKSIHDYRGKSNHISSMYCLAYCMETCQDRDEGGYYIVQPDEIIVAERCDDDDKVEFLLHRKQYREAYALGKLRPLKRYDVERLGTILLNFLVSEENYEEAASRFREVLGTTDDAEPKWKRWIDLYIHRGKEEFLVKELPFMENSVLNGPRLHQKIYEKVLAACLERDQIALFKAHVLKFWRLYNPTTVANFLEYRYKRMRTEKAKGLISENQLILAGEALGLLLELQEKFGEALGVFLDVRGGNELFDFIERHKLFNEAAEVLDTLFLKNEKRTIHLLLHHKAQIDENAVDPLGPEAVIKKLGNVNRDKLWVYLEALRRQDGALYQKTARDHSELFTLLHATYDRKRLLPFLKSILPSLNLKATFEICKEKGLVEERVYIMARMGNRDEGLDVIVREMKNVGKAIDYIRDFESEEDQKELYDRLFNLIFLAEENSPNFTHKIDFGEPTLTDVMNMYGVQKEDVRVSLLTRLRIDDQEIGVEIGESLQSIAEAHNVPMEEIVLLPPCEVQVTPHMLSQLLTAISDPQIGETSAIDAASVVKRIPKDHNIRNLGQSLSAIMSSKGGYAALMETLLRVLDGDVGDMQKIYRRNAIRTIRVDPAVDRQCSLCHSLIEQESMVIFNNCRHTMHAPCMFKEVRQDEALKGAWLQQTEDPDELFRRPYQFLRDRVNRPAITCRTCPQSDGSTGL